MEIKIIIMGCGGSKGVEEKKEEPQQVNEENGENKPEENKPEEAKPVEGAEENKPEEQAAA